MIMRRQSVGQTTSLHKALRAVAWSGADGCARRTFKVANGVERGSGCRCCFNSDDAKEDASDEDDKLRELHDNCVLS